MPAVMTGQSFLNIQTNVVGLPWRPMKACRKRILPKKAIGGMSKQLAST